MSQPPTSNGGGGGGSSPRAGPTRVLVVYDSAFARKVLRETLASSSELEVVGFARDGLEALEKIAELAPDVVTLDLVMPNLDGLGVLRALPPGGRPRVVVVSMSDADSALGIEALENGAFDLVHKPTALATERLYELSAELIAKVIAAGESARAAPSARPNATAPSDASRAATVTGARPVPAAAGRAADWAFRRVSTGPIHPLVVIGTSTGGPQALTRLLGDLPADFPAAVVVALHIPAGYTEALAHRLDQLAALPIFHASDGAELRPGTVAIAPGGAQLRVAVSGASGLVARVTYEPEDGPAQRAATAAGRRFAPSVDVLFESAASCLGAGVLAVVLTGMGDDGLAGARAIRARGGAVLTEAEVSCVVYGMPRAVAEAGLATATFPLEEMAEGILRHL